ncbi:hypothetical protein LINPERHAP2_LOCUS33151, partial [Linum perenne]
FLVRFSEATDYKRAGFDGPWKIYDYYITVAQWTPAYNEEKPIQKILMWVRLPRLPIHYFNRVAVSRIGNFIGRTVRLDLATAEGATARYARVCVEVDLSKLLLGKYIIENRVLHIEYESLENISFGCGIYGHRGDACSSAPKPKETEVPEKETDHTMNTTQGEGDAVSWMTVQRRQRNKNVKGTSTVGVPSANGPRFTVICSEEQIQNDKELAHPPSNKEDTPMTSAGISHESHAEAFLKALNEVDVNHIHSSHSNATKDRTPLCDRTNLSNQMLKKVAGTKKTPNQVSKALSNETELVTVPVTYHNPVFDSENSVLTSTKGKGKEIKKKLAERSRTPKSTTETVSKPKQRSFKKTEKVTQDPKQASSCQGQLTGSPTATEKSGEPPDGSC